ncbi:transposase [Spirosoma arboris]|uniref:transposase n=1 Tax=Spirosoma arboris TaxID=2682092 RepID=UPI0018DD2AB9|nr:transposase [Spirosoma arboris]
MLTYEVYLRQRWQAGETCVKTLFEEIKIQGYYGRYTILAAFLANYPRPSYAPTLPPAQKEFSYSSRRLSRLLGQLAVEWPETDRPFLKHLLHSNELIGQVHQLSLRFKQLMQDRQAEELANWCADAEGIPVLSGFVRGMRQDFAAVEEAFRSEWSNGQTEGQVNRLKTIKRTIYGKAKFDLLRLRVLTRNWTTPPN